MPQGAARGKRLTPAGGHGHAAAMSDAPFAARLTRSPWPFDRDRGEEGARAVPRQPPEIRELLVGTAGCSPFLKAAMEREAEWLAAALAEAPERVLADLLDGVAALDDRGAPAGLRIAKRRVALLAALTDLGGVWPLESVTGALTRFADAAVARALRACLAAEIARRRLPALSADDLDAPGMVVLAMGKMGAFELNYSSDIDLICLFDESRFDPDAYLDMRTGFVRATRAMAAMLSDTGAEGYVFRTDLRLRPDPSVTPVCLAFEAAERYYESLGRTWERAAHIKARPCAGDIPAGETYLERLRPFVWRKHLDFAAIQDAHDMRLRIRSHKGLGGPITLDGHDMKLGRGGIREIEFFTQTRQIIAGGRDPSLRVRGTVEGLERLAAAGWVPGEIADVLAADYRAHREVEHRLQMINDAQTHLLPSGEDGFARLAAFTGCDAADLRADLDERLTRVAELTEDFFAPSTGRMGGDAPELSPDQAEIVARWRSYPALRSERAQTIFERLRPLLLDKLDRAADPGRALVHLDGFLAGLPAGVQLFSLFEANPQLVDLVIDIADAAPGLAAYLSRNAHVFDAVIGGSFFAEWPGRDALCAELAARIADAPDYEARLDVARRWTKEWHFRVGVHHLRGLIDGAEAGRQYADLADAVLSRLLPAVVEDFATRHGPPPGRGAMVLGMGSLGARLLHAASDLDLIVIYDAAGVEASEGPRALASRTYYARLTQHLVTALSAPMAEGRLYEVDMRLRPSGKQGPVATALAAFRSYQTEEAWTWEHLALTRARPVAGPSDLMDEVERFRRDLIAAPRDAGPTAAAVADMRARLAEAKGGGGGLSFKTGPGRLQDIELAAALLALLGGSDARAAADQIASAEAAGIVDRGEAATLTETHERLWQAQAALRLLGRDAQGAPPAGARAAAFLERDAGAPPPELVGQAAGAASAIDGLLARLGGAR